MPANPISPYAVSKLAAEHYCRTFARLYGLETVSLRYFNVFGPRQNPESKYSAVIPRFLQLALQHEPLEIHGDGEQSRDFTYIDNVVQGNLRAMDTPGVSGEVFNIACGTRHSLLAIADAIGAFLGRELPRTAHAAPRGRRQAHARRHLQGRAPARLPAPGGLRDRHPTDLRVLRQALRWGPAAAAAS